MFKSRCSLYAGEDSFGIGVTRQLRCQEEQGIKKHCQIVTDLNITYHDANKDHGDILHIQPHTHWLQILKPLLSQCFFIVGL